MLQGARDGLEVRELSEIAVPLHQVGLPQVDKPLAKRGVDPVQLILRRADGYVSGADFAVFRGVQFPVR